MNNPETIAPRNGEGLPLEALTDYLNQVFADGAARLQVRQFPAGHSNLTYLISRKGIDYVLRRPPMGKIAQSAHDMQREYRVLSALQGQFPLSPRIVCFCEDPLVIGAPFYLMQRLHGIILHKNVPQGVRLDAKQARQLCQNSAAVLATLHAIDLRKSGLSQLGQIEGYVARQVSGWSKRFRNAHTKGVPNGETIMQWLVDSMPAESAAGCLIHNDYKFDNLVLASDDPSRVVGVLDWEMATIGDPLMDLGCSLAYWIEAEDPADLQKIRMLPTHRPGMMSRREFLECYLARADLDCQDFLFYRVFGLFRLAVIVQQIYYRYCKGQTRDARFKSFGAFASVLLEAADKAYKTL